MLVYSLVGVLVGVAAVLLVLYYQKAQLSAGKRAAVYVLWLVGILLIAFSCDWGYASLVEGEPQAMAMGFLVFGGIGVVLSVIALRLGMSKGQKEKAESGEQA